MNTPHFFQPGCKLVSIADRRGQEQQPNSRRSKNDCFFPNVTTVFVSEVMSLIEHNKISCHFLSTSQRIEQLIAIDLGRTNDKRSIRIFFSIARQNADSICSKLI